jgi:hypothetical protein
MTTSNPLPSGVRAIFKAAVFLLAVIATTSSVRAQDEFARLEAMWKRGEYSNTIDALVEFRKRTRKRNCQIDYMIATSACRSQRRQAGRMFFTWILDNYSLSAQNRKIIEQESESCSVGEAPATLRASTPATLVGIVYSGKGGTEYLANSSGNGSAELVEAIPPEVFASRLFAPSQSQAALASVRALLGPAAQIELVGTMILAAPAVDPPYSLGGPEVPNRRVVPHTPAIPKEPVTPNQSAIPNEPPVPNKSPAKPTKATAGVEPTGVNPSSVNSAGINAAAPPNQASQTNVRQSREPEQMIQQQAYRSTERSDLGPAGRDLQRFAQFFVAEYKMQPPSHLITVYFTPGVKDLRSLARKIHGIDLAPGSIGYSFPGDQSMVGWADGRAYGTFAHELFHLMVRGNFGDAPPWLDEGMAALYEVSGFDGDRAVGKVNWRGVILQKLWAARPSLKELVQMDRSRFDVIDQSSRTPLGREELAAGEKQAVNHATARYFMLYLQERHQLREVYLSFFNREVTDQGGTRAIELLESVLRRPLDQVDADFADWFKSIRN